MAWGLWNKIKKGFKKVGSAFKKAANFVNDKVIKPFKPAIKGIADRFIPGAGAAVDMASGAVDAIANGDYGGAKASAADIAEWARKNLR